MLGIDQYSHQIHTIQIIQYEKRHKSFNVNHKMSSQKWRLLLPLACSSKDGEYNVKFQLL